MLLPGILSYPIGLDISDLSFKFIQLKKQTGGFGIQALGRIDLPKGVIEKGEIKDEQKALELLKKALQNPAFGKIKTDKIVACLPETKTFVKLIKIRKGPNKPEDLIEMEIKKHIPLEFKNMHYDWQIIEENADFQSVLVGASLRKIVDQYTSFLDQAGFFIEALEIEPISICRSLLKEEFGHSLSGENNYIILDIGASRSSIVFYSKNTILFTISVPLTVSEVKKNKDKTISEFKKRIQEALDFYEDNFLERGKISKIIICGGGASVSEIKAEFESFSFSVEIGNPLINSPIKNFSKYFVAPDYFLPSFATAIGLTLLKTEDY